MSDALKLVWSAEQVAVALEVSADTIRKWHKQGVIQPVARRGRIIKFDLAEVRAALKADAATPIPKRRNFLA